MEHALLYCAKTRVLCIQTRVYWLVTELVSSRTGAALSHHIVIKGTLTFNGATGIFKLFSRGTAVLLVHVFGK